MVKQGDFQIIYSDIKGGFGYSSGHTVSGNVCLSLDEPLKLRGIRITFFGKAHVKWVERLRTDEGDKKETETVEQSAEEIYFNERQLIWGEDVESDHWEILPAGKHEFPFNFRLPSDLPSSFESRHGYVRYYARATIDKPWKKDDHVEKPFVIHGQLDLCKPDLATGNFEHSVEEVMCCGCFSKGTFGVTLLMAKRGFVAGENVEITAKISNNTRNTCVSNLSMKMTLHLRTSEKVKVEEAVLAQTSHVTYADKTETWLASLLVPDVPPSGLGGCGIIDPRYTVHFSMEPSGCNCDSIEMSVGIIVGTSLEGINEENART